MDPLMGIVLVVIAAVTLVFGQRNLDGLPVEVEDAADDTD